jgi:glucose/arabinose dehydrogenase
MRYFRVITSFLICLAWLGVSQAQLPDGFIRDAYISDLNQPVGVTFDDNGMMYIWEKGGTVQVVNNGVKRISPFLDISEEVGNWRDHGLNGFALDPYYTTNGYIYLMYVVDRHHLLNFGTPSYDPAQDELYAATIGRITRYTVLNPNDPANATVDLGSRQVLLGATVSSGFPILFGTHGVGELLFGDDGSLIATAGDGASTAADYGGPLTASYSVQALADGIINTKQDIGVFRSQSLSSLSGKMIRINPATGEGYDTNPFYNPLEPKSARSRTWALGLRNPFSVSKKPNTGSHNPADGEPGVFFIGDVGLNRWEEMNVVTGPGQNFGWPMYEGMNHTEDFGGGFVDAEIENLDAPITGGCGQSHYYYYQLFSDIEPGVPAAWPDPCNPGSNINASQYTLFTHRKPAFSWIHEQFDKNLATNNPNYTDIYSVASNQDTGEEYDMADPNTPIKGGLDWKGNCAIAGLWYEGTDFPEEYQNTYFSADHNSAWIRVFKFDLTNNPDSVGDFGEPGQMGFVTSMDQHPGYDGFFYVAYNDQAVYHVYYSADGNQPPKPGMTLDNYYSATNGLTTNFGSSTSSDPEGAALTFDWDFGDGNNASGDSVSHTFNVAGGTQQVYTVTLTVTDTGGLARTIQRNVYLNNTPPVINSTSVDGLDVYPLHQITPIDLFADVTDVENTALSYRWQTVLFHESHNHPEPFDYNDTTLTFADPVGCDGHYYMLQLSLRVADSTGLSTTYIKEVYPDCNTPVAQSDFGSYIGGGIERISPFTNDMALDGVDSTSLNITIAPLHGSAVYQPTTGQILYTHDGSSGTQDTLTYRYRDLEGDWSNEAMVILARDSAPTITSLNPLEGGVVEGSRLKVEYDISGKELDANNLFVTFDGSKTVIDESLQGFFQVQDLEEGPHTMTMQLRDASNQPLPYAASQSTVNFTVTCASSTGSLLLEYWNNIPGGSIEDLTSSPNYPDNPTTYNYLTGSNTNNDVTNNDGYRMRGYLTPPRTGTYYFQVTGNDAYQMFVSSDDSESNAAQIISQDSATNEATRGPMNQYTPVVSGPISMVEGQRHYLEVLQKAGQFDGTFTVEWRRFPNDGTDGNPAGPGHLNNYNTFRVGFISPWVPCFDGSTTFPVELLDFSAMLDRDAVQIRWTTATEQDNDYFMVQRSIDGDSFEDLIRQPSLGNSSELQSYRATDERPVPGRSYYRLKQVDLDGSMTFSSKVEVSVAAESFLIFPNPGNAKQGFNVQVFGHSGSNYQVQLLNTMGQVVFTDQAVGSSDGSVIAVPADRLSPGHYLMRIYNPTEQWTEKVILH